MPEAETAPLSPIEPEPAKLVTFADFDKVKMVTAEVVSAAPHPKADRLLVLGIKIGDKTKQIVAGIREHYKCEQSLSVDFNDGLPCIIGKTIIVGVESAGMLLAVRTKDGLRLLTTDGPAESGLSVG